MFDTLRHHRVGMIAWVVAGTAGMFFMGLSLAEEMRVFPGGASALATTVMPAAEALRLLRWPAERLDTLGGYMTYHNIILIQGFLALYAAVQAARATRGSEEHLTTEELLATGWSRPALMRDRALGFFVVLLVIWIGLSAGVAASLAASGEPNTVGSFISMGAVALCTFIAYAMAVLISQFARTSRTAAGISALALIAMYLVTNAGDKLGPLAFLQVASPFTWANRSRALVPGYGLDVPAMLALLVAALTLLALAMWAFQARDYAGVVWSRPRSATHARTVVVEHWWLGQWWTAHLMVHRWGLIAWTATTTAFVGVMMALQPSVLDAWLAFDFWAAVMGGLGAISPEAMYTSFIIDILAPIVVAYAIAQTSGWVADLHEGRVEMLLAAPVTWARLILERLTALLAGTVIITTCAVVAIVVGSWALDAPVDASGVARSLTTTLLLATAIGAIALAAVAVFRSRIAVTALAVYAGAAYLLTWMIPIFTWPQWTYRLTIFDAFGHPYQEWPESGDAMLLISLAAVGILLAVVVASRSPKIAAAH